MQHISVHFRTCAFASELVLELMEAVNSQCHCIQMVTILFFNFVDAVKLAFDCIHLIDYSNASSNAKANANQKHILTQSVFFMDCTSIRKNENMISCSFELFLSLDLFHVFAIWHYITF